VTDRAHRVPKSARSVPGDSARLSQQQIARVLGISIKTVQHHLESVMDKLEIHDRVELSRYAIREGWLEP